MDWKVSNKEYRKNIEKYIHDIEYAKISYTLNKTVIIE